jgi:hypothetical protein
VKKEEGSKKIFFAVLREIFPEKYENFKENKRFKEIF